MPSFEDMMGRPIGTEKAREMGKKGAIKSAEVRRRNKTIREATRAILSGPATGLKINDDIAAYLRAAGIDSPTGADVLAAVAYIKALAKSDIEAARFVRDSSGEVPTAKVELTGADGGPIVGMDLSALTDAQLQALADNAGD